MRLFPFFALLVTACSPPAPPPGLPNGSYAGAGRNRLCVARDGSGQRAGLIVYGPGNVNCSASGRLDGEGANLALVPRGEGDCRIALGQSGGVIKVGPVPASCAYYCGPGASLAGATFAGPPSSAPAVDLAGDPLC